MLYGMHGVKICLSIFLIFTFMASIPAQDKPGSVDRQPVVAGSFYPENPVALRNMLEDFFKDTKREIPSGKNIPVALVSPHAGYIFSGRVSAWSYAQLDPDTQYDNIFIIGTSHYEQFDGASVYNAGDYITPLGKVVVNREIADALISGSPYITFDAVSHKKEHSIEVQLPFLQFYLKKSFKIVPILLGTSDPSVIASVAGQLDKYKTEGNLFILSTDFSHYPSYRDAVKTDSLTAKAFMSFDPEFFAGYVRNIERKPVSGLLTPMCGWPSALVVMRLFHDESRYSCTPLFYQNSGDSKFGDKNRVVGYYAMLITQKLSSMEEKDSNLTGSVKSLLLKIARESLEYYLRTGKVMDYDENVLPDVLLEKRGVFITLYEGKSLRGCIGRFLPNEPLYRVVEQMAISSAVRDHRFGPLTYDELSTVRISISVLSPLKKITSIDELVLGKDGILIKKGNISGTFLPQVATETGWSKEEFLGHCSADKAGLGWDGWKSAELFVYTAEIFSENESGI